MNDNKNTAPLTPYGENGFKKATVAVQEDGSLKIVPAGGGRNSKSSYYYLDR